MARVAIKRLAAVEIEPEASHQHEFNAGALRSGLGFPEGRSEGDLQILCYGTALDSGPIVLEGTFTLYDARENHPTRSEYRMYYQLPGLEVVARPNDLLILCRFGRGFELHGILARAGSKMERRLERLIRLGDHEAVRSLAVREVPKADANDRNEFVRTLLPEVGPPSLSRSVREHELFRRAVSDRVVPPTAVMAEAGRYLARQVWGKGLDADSFIERGLAAESELYFAIEKEVGTVQLQQLTADGALQLDQMLSWALRIQQSRKSRRGQSLQHHFAFLLSREKIPFTAQCHTEGRERPDFIIPGQEAYRAKTFPAERLRMIACKSTVRERWAQILKEAARIPVKYLLTVDANLTDDVFRLMASHSVRVFMPAATIASYYSASSERAKVGTISDLVRDLRRIVQ